MNIDTLSHKLSQTSIPIKEVNDIYNNHKGDAQIESMIAMNLSQRTSVYDHLLEKSETISTLLQELAHSSSMEARWAVAKNPHTPISTLKHLANDDVNLVRALVATNPYTPTQSLIQFFSDEKIVRDGLSGNPNTPLKYLKLLSDDTDKMVRLRIAENPSVSSEILTKLQCDKDQDVATAATIKLQEKKEQHA